MEQTEQKTFTRQEIIANLKEAIELQSLQTELQELRTKMFLAKANEAMAISKLEEMYSKEQSDSKENLKNQD